MTSPGIGLLLPLKRPALATPDVVGVVKPGPFYFGVDAEPFEDRRDRSAGPNTRYVVDSRVKTEHVRRAKMLNLACPALTETTRRVVLLGNQDPGTGIGE